MKKSVYSVVLMDDVVEALDRMAYQLQTSRSNLMNQLLAERLSVTTPEMQIKNVFDTVERLLQQHSHFQIQQQAADCMLSIRSVLKYKYNPTLRYAILLNRNREDEIGQLKIISRSQSNVLQQHLNCFFAMWNHCEARQNRLQWENDQTGKWQRLLKTREKEETEDTLANEIVHYVRTMDQGLGIYFKYNGQPSICEEMLQSHYNQAIKKITTFN